jgi:hypothetical protein
MRKPRVLILEDDGFTFLQMGYSIWLIANLYFDTL